MIWLRHYISGLGIGGSKIHHSFMCKSYISKDIDIDNDKLLLLYARHTLVPRKIKAVFLLINLIFRLQKSRGKFVSISPVTSNSLLRMRFFLIN